MRLDLGTHTATSGRSSHNKLKQKRIAFNGTEKPLCTTWSGGVNQFFKSKLHNNENNLDMGGDVPRDSKIR